MLLFSEKNIEIALIAFILDMLFGEFKYITHPVVLMGRLFMVREDIL